MMQTVNQSSPSAATVREIPSMAMLPFGAFPDLQMGESIAVNGVCLTLEKDLGGNLLEFHVMEESFRRTNLGNLNTGDLVNLERALAVGDRLGGHIVSGHVDGTGTVLSLGKNGDDTELKVAVSPEVREQM